MSPAAGGDFFPWVCPRVTLAALGYHEWALQGTCPLWFGKLKKDVSKLCQIVENHCKSQASLGAQLVKNRPAMPETRFDSWVAKFPWKGIGCPLQCSWASLVAQTVKNPPAMWETSVRSLGWEDPWRRALRPTPVFLPGEFPWTEEPGRLQTMGSQSQTRLSN